MNQKLALLGGEPVRKKPFSPWPTYAKDEMDAVTAVLSSGKVNAWTGTEVSDFEKAFASYVGVNHGVAVANGTVALELALQALGIGKDDEVIVTSRTFIASVSAIVLSGAKPVFADVDPESQNITAETIKKALTPKTRALLLVHLAGWPCEMDDIMSFAQKHALFVVEDCAQAHGAFYKGKSVGSFGHVSAFSFCQDKIMTTGGEGGMLLTNDDDLFHRAWSFKDHGKNRKTALMRQEQGGFRWLHDHFGTNWRLTGMQAAIGLQQLKKLGDWTQVRNQYAQRLNTGLGKLPAIRLTRPPEYIQHAYYKFYFFIRLSLLKEDWDRDKILDALRAEGIPCGSGSCSEVYLEKAFETTDFRPPSRLPVAQTLSQTSMMLMIHPTLSEQDIDDMIGAVKKVMNEVAV